MLDMQQASLSWMAEADIRLNESLKQVLSEPNVPVPDVPDIKDWVMKRTAELNNLHETDPVAHQAVIDKKEPLWQVAFLQDLGKKGLLRNFILRLDSDSISVMVEPIFPGRFLQLKLEGRGVRSAPWMN